MKQHLQEFDLLRALATFTVIAIHITAAYVLISPLGYIGNQLARFAVPLFIILSGFLLYNADLNGNGFKIGDFYRRRFDRILWPYILWTCFYVFLGGMIGGNPGLAIKQLPVHLLWGTGSYHLYFLVIMIQLYLLYPLFRMTLQKKPAILIAGSFLLTLLAQIFLYLIMLGKISIDPAYNSFNLVFFPVWLFYFVLGMWAAQEKEHWQQKLAGKELLLTCIWVISLTLLFLDSHYTGAYGSSIRPSVMLYTISSYFLFYALARHGQHRKAGLIHWIAQQSFLIYLIHPAILSAVIYTAIYAGWIDLWAGTRGMLAQYLLVTMLSLLFTYLISLTPLADKLGGKRAKIKPARVSSGPTNKDLE